MALCSGIFTNTANATTTTSISTAESIAVASSDWDALLDEYEQYVDQYIKTYKKAMNGDMSAMAEYANLAAKAQKIADKLEKAKGEMTTAQTQRYLKIVKKMTDALK